MEVMSIRRSIVLCGIGILLSPALQLAQTANDKQSQIEEHSRKAQEYLREKQPGLAIPELQALTTLDPQNYEAQANLGVLLFFQSKPADAIPHLRAALDRQPSLANIQSVLGLAEVSTQDFEQGRKDLEVAFPLTEELKLKIRVGLELVGLYTQNGDLSQASRIVAQLRTAAPDNAEVLYAAYRTYSDLSGESMLALSLAAPDSAQMHQLLAHEELKEGNTNGAIAQYRKAIAIDPHLPGIHFELAEVLHSSLDQAAKTEAEQEYHTALRENPQDEKAICRLAEIATQKGNIQQAYEGYTRAVGLQPSDADAKLGLAKTLIEMNQTDRAVTLLEDTVRLEPTNAVAHYRLGTLYRKLGRSEDAVREVDLYKKYKDMKEKMRAIYKGLLIQPEQIRASGQDEE
jgi:tetratricopeptide (TPR) repeat protein